MATNDRVLLTVLLHHDQSKPLDEIMAHLKKTGFYRDFPPEGSELVSWVVAMSFGFIIQLSVEPEPSYATFQSWLGIRHSTLPLVWTSTQARAPAVIRSTRIAVALNSAVPDLGS